MRKNVFLKSSIWVSEIIVVEWLNNVCVVNFFNGFFFILLVYYVRLDLYLYVFDLWVVLVL